MTIIFAWREQWISLSKWIQNKEKVWETIGEPKLIIYSRYRMNLLVTPGLKNT